MSKSNLNNTSNTNSSYGTVNPNANGNTNTDNNQAQVNQATNSSYGQGNSQSTSVLDNPPTGIEGYGSDWQNTPFGGSTSSTNLPSVSATQNTQPVNKWATFLNAVENFSESEISSAFGVGGAVLNAGLNAAAPSLVNGLQNEVAEHGSFGLEIAAGGGLGFDIEAAFSQKGITIFGGGGVGYGFDISESENFDLQDMNGFTSKTAINIGEGPIQFGASLMVSETGLSAGVDMQRHVGPSVEIETVVGYTKTIPWEDATNYLQAMRL